MERKYLPSTASAILFFLSSVFAAVDRLPLVDLNTLNVASIAKTDATVELVTKSAGGKALKVTFGTQAQRPNITLLSTAGNLSAYVSIRMNIYNAGTKDAAILANFNANASDNCWVNGIAIVKPGETKTLSILLFRSSFPSTISRYFTGMNGVPGGFLYHFGGTDNLTINRVVLYDVMPKDGAIVEIDSIRAEPLTSAPDTTLLKTAFFPFVDTFGQYKYTQWPGKAKSTADLLAQAQTEQADLTANSGPSDWGTYGGWKSGPKLSATGHFRVEKYQNKWWMVDPEGYLFWSNGIDCVRTSEATNTSGRTNYYTVIPPNGNFLEANIARKFGSNWSASYPNLIHQRLRSWGINTIGNWSNQSISNMHKTPYTVNLSSSGPGATSDSAAFLSNFASRMAGQANTTANDPWCIGYFVDNEIGSWGDGSVATIERYYRLVKQGIKSVAPNKLYLGSRLGWTASVGTGWEQTIGLAASKYCDAVSINPYCYSARDLAVAASFDRPVIVGEFHYGALDRGMLHTGLRAVIDQEMRGRAYANFIKTGLDNPKLVGAHWFQYADESITGRGDGENYQIGFINSCDRPYPEIVSAARETNYNMYQYRLNGSVAVRPSSAPSTAPIAGRATTVRLGALVGTPIALRGTTTAAAKISVYDLSGRYIKKACTVQSIKKENLQGVYVLKIENLSR